MDALSKKTNFIVEQGFEAPPSSSCPVMYSALLFQPRVVGTIVLIAALLRSAPIFLVLGAILWWSAAMPRWNPFDAAYNALLAGRSGMRLQPAPSPRRFAQTLAGAFAVTIALLLVTGFTVAAIIVEVLLLVAVALLVFGGFCFGSYVFHLLRHA